MYIIALLMNLGKGDPGSNDVEEVEGISFSEALRNVDREWRRAFYGSFGIEDENEHRRDVALRLGLPADSTEEEVGAAFRVRDILFSEEAPVKEVAKRYSDYVRLLLARLEFAGSTLSESVFSSLRGLCGKLVPADVLEKFNLVVISGEAGQGGYSVSAILKARVDEGNVSVSEMETFSDMIKLYGAMLEVGFVEAGIVVQCRDGCHLEFVVPYEMTGELS